MEFRVLGSLEVCDQGELVELGPPRIRVLCGVLLVRSGELVPVEQLIDELWPDRPPPDARALVRGYVSRLRRALRSGPSGECRVVTRKPGYLLRVEEQELDLRRFQQLVGEARAARQAGQPQHSVELFRQAHELWRGDSLAERRTRVVVTVQGTSMRPTYHHGDRVVVRRCRLAAVRAGQVVVLHSATPEAPTAERWITKRVVAVPGEPVPRGRFPIADPVVPAGSVLLLGDNPRTSADSRQHGYYAGTHLVGVVTRAMPGRGASPRGCGR